MIENAKSYILTDVSLYIDEMLSSFCNIKPSPSLQAVCEHLLSATFLQMIGAIEQKIYNIKWYLGFSDYSLRYDIQKDFSKQSSSLKELCNVYSLLEKKINISGEDVVPKDIWNDDKNTIKAYKIVHEMFSNSNIIEYTNCDFVEYEKNDLLSFFSRWEKTQDKHASTASRVRKARLLKILNNFKKRYKALETKVNEELSGSGLKVGGQNVPEYRASILKAYYAKMMQYRHSIAHNFNSHRHDLPLIPVLSSSIHRFDTYYYRYMICVYIDLKIQDTFSKLLKVHSKLLS